VIAIPTEFHAENDEMDDEWPKGKESPQRSIEKKHLADPSR
jgi:hypothetical protein